MWQTFWQYNKVKISKIQISVSMIIFHMLRNGLTTPKFSIVMPFEQVDADGKDMIVKKPDPLNFYGVFIPCAHFQHLQVFEPETLHEQLVQAVVRMNDA